jgi:hypothetical protein
MRVGEADPVALNEAKKGRSRHLRLHGGGVSQRRLELGGGDYGLGEGPVVPSHPQLPEPLGHRLESFNPDWPGEVAPERHRQADCAAAGILRFRHDLDRFLAAPARA